MSSQVSLPYWTPAQNRIILSNWRISTPFGSGPLQEELRGWDFATNLAVAVQLDVDLNGALEDCGLSNSSELIGLIRWQSTRTGIRRSSSPMRLVDGTNELHLDLLGTEIGRKLLFEAAVVVQDPGNGSTGFAPTRPGSILWREKTSVLIEGDAERFPIELRSFKAAGITGADAAWALHWDSVDPNSSAGSAMRLWLNSDHPVAAKLTASEPDAAVLSVLKFDLTRQLIQQALEMNDLTDGQWPEGSLGASLLERIHAAFPGYSLDDCRTLQRDSREDFETAIQSVTAMLGD